jgi:hypothetical protein
MRVANLLGLVLFGIVAIILAPAETTGQPGGFGGKGKGKTGAIPGGGGFPGGGGGMGQDPNKMFDYLAKDRQFFQISETRTLAQPLTQFAQERRITNGQITRQQFLDFQDWRAKQQAAAGGTGGAPGGQFGGAPGGGFGGFGKKNGSEKGGPPTNDPEVLNQRADEEFRKRDDNNDGRLTPQEASDKLRRDFARWDTDGSGTLDITEYRTYFASRTQGGDDRGAAAIIIQEEDLDAKPVVFRAGAGGKMPAGLPSWFLELDTDKDGQVALYEWRRSGKAFDDFSNWDLNGDGFITPEEALSRQTVIAKTSRGSMGAMAFGEEGGEMRKMKGFGGKGEGGFKGFGGEGGFKGFGGEGFKGWPKGGGDGSAERPAFPSFGGPRPGQDGTTDSGERKGKNGKKKGG